MPALLCNGAITTTSASESVEIGKSRVQSIVRISSAFATIRLEGVGSSGTAFGWTIQRNNSLNSTTCMLGTTVYQTWANSLNTFSKDIACPNTVASGNISIGGNLSITGNTRMIGSLTVNGSFSNPSDENIKTNINNLSQEDAIFV